MIKRLSLENVALKKKINELYINNLEIVRENNSLHEQLQKITGFKYQQVKLFKCHSQKNMTLLPDSQTHKVKKKKSLSQFFQLDSVSLTQIQEEVNVFKKYMKGNQKNHQRFQNKIDELIKQSFIDNKQINELIELTKSDYEKDFDVQSHYFQQYIEEYIFRKIQKKAFQITDDDQMKNQQLNQKIEIIQNYLTPDMLQIDKENIDMRVISSVIIEMNKMNFTPNPNTKLKILQNVFNSLQKLYPKQQVGADLLYPWIVYLTIFSKIDFLQKNLLFIKKFINPSELIGVKGFILSSFDTVYYLIENINGQELMNGKLNIIKKQLNQI